MGSQHIAIIDGDSARLMRMTVALSTLRFVVTAVEAPDTMKAARDLLRTSAPEGMIVVLNRAGNVVELRELLAQATNTRVLFVVPAMPVRATIARILKEYGATALAEREAPLVLAATLVALLAQPALDGV